MKGNETKECLKGMSLDDLSEACAKAKKEKILNPKWGYWKFNKKSFTLVLRGPFMFYDVDLKGIKTSAEMLDWIFQIANKVWVQRNPSVLSDFIEALNFLLYPQENYCSFGRSKVVDNPKEIVKKRMTMT